MLDRSDSSAPRPAPEAPDHLRRDPPTRIAMGRGAATRRASFAVALLAVALFFASALHGIASPFYYGHYGYHGGSYATWARGTLRHHTMLPVNEPGFAPPRPGTYYIHHPILTHQLVTLTFTIFGEHEWSVRLAALIPSFLSLLLVTSIAWRWLGPLAGAVAALVFAIVPVNVWYAAHIDQGFPSIACLLGFFWFYLRWLDTGRWSLAWAALGLEALAGGFEWSPYFAFPAIFAHVLWTGWRRRGRFLTFTALHPLVVLGPLAAHAFAVWRSGMLADLLGAYRNRAADVTYATFAHVMRQYAETLFGRALLAAMVVWTVVTIARVVTGRGRAVDLVGLTFAFALLTYVHVFKVAVITHAYRQLYANVWATMAVADLVTRAGRAAAWLWSRWSRRAATAASSGSAAAAQAASVGKASAIAVLLATLLLGATAPIAWAGLIESRAHGGIPGWKTFDPDLRQTAFAREVNRATRPGDVIYFHPSFAYPPPTRMDWAFYYDRDMRRSIYLRTLQRLPPGDLSHAVAILLPASLRGDELRAYAELARQHPVLWVGDLAMLDLRTNGPQTRALALGPVDRGHSGPIGRWLNGPYPWPRLVPDARRLATAQLLVQSLPVAGARPLPALVARPTPAPPVGQPTLPAARAGAVAAQVKPVPVKQRPRKRHPVPQTR